MKPRGWNSTLPRATKPMNRVNRKRKKREHARAYDSQAFILWTQAQPSVASGKGPCVCSHVPPEGELPSGMGRKADAKWVVPLTLKEERDELHQHGVESFQENYGIDLAECARKHWANWRELEG